MQQVAHEDSVMTLEPLLQTTLAVQIHTLAAVLAFGIGIGQFLLPRGSTVHRVVGWSWVGLMAVTAGSSFFIHMGRVFGIWSPIHLLSIFTLVMLVLAVRAARRRDVATHRSIMISLFVFALVGAGAFTFLPGRIMHVVVFGG